MPGLVNDKLAAKKRKRDTEPSSEKGAIKRKARKNTDTENGTAEDAQSQILLLETQILESRRHYNNIAKLISLLRQPSSKTEDHLAAAISLCRVFCRLRAAGNLNKSKGLSENELLIVQWLKERYAEYVTCLLDLLTEGKPGDQTTALTLLLRLVKDETSNMKGGAEEYPWRSSTFSSLVRQLLTLEDGADIIGEFVESFVAEYDDIRFYTCNIIADITSGELEARVTPTLSRNILSILSVLQNPPEKKDDLEDFYTEPPKKSNHSLFSPTSHKKQVQEAWLSLLRLGLDKDQRKTVLGLISQRVAPWFVKVEMLMDFLTDSYNYGGATSLLALSGLFYLIQEKNLDYPMFYQKLYSLLDETILHSKHRSRFFRLLDTFLDSSHLPAALVASFIKRLSRLALNAPPAGIVVIIPWIYNLFKKHPTCTFMMHREVRGEDAKERIARDGMNDPFDMAEVDPMKTHAIDSSIWEIENLQSHYHPNVATLAKIISQQFTKLSYNLEDFLDLSYQSMQEMELSKEMKKTPVVEYEIPRKIFTKSTDPALQDSLLVKLWDFS